MSKEPEWIESEWAHQLLVYADDVNLLGENINAVKKDTEAILSATYFATKFEIKL
jgi:hypothetical protein